jgi:hypothetical protein
LWVWASGGPSDVPGAPCATAAEFKPRDSSLDAAPVLAAGQASAPQQAGKLVTLEREAEFSGTQVDRFTRGISLNTNTRHRSLQDAPGATGTNTSDPNR